MDASGTLRQGTQAISICGRAGMKGGPKGPRVMDPLPWRPRKRGSEQFVEFARRFLVTPKGAGAKKPIRVRDWQRELVGTLLDDDRPLRIRVTVISRPDEFDTRQAIREAVFRGVRRSEAEVEYRFFV